MKKYVLALDQGTTSSRAILFDAQGVPVAQSQKEFSQHFPHPGWVEHDPNEIWNSQIYVAREVIRKAGASPAEIAAIGIANQRETTIVWDRKTGEPVHNAIVWQDRRTADNCTAMKKKKMDAYVQQATGLVIDAYFSATKISWILDHIKNGRQRARMGDLLFGTVDSWLAYKLSGGHLHITDYSNASRTMLYNIKTLKWDAKLLAYFDIPEIMMPLVRNSSEIYGFTDERMFDGARIPLSGIAGDQQAALFGQSCFSEGMAKNTYGTGCFMLMLTGKKPVVSKKGLLTTIAWGIDGKVEYALEGSVFVAGAAVQWLRDGINILESAADSEFQAAKVSDSGGVVVVPAFAGMGAPYWDMYARGAILGLTRGTTRAHIIRATLESLAFQTRDLLNLMEAESKLKLKQLRVDGGAVANNLLMQFQADMLGVPVERPRVTETTALGAAYLAGLATGFYKKTNLSKNRDTERVFKPEYKPARREELYKNWHKAVQRVLGWAK